MDIQKSTVPRPRRHVWDDDAICIYCGMDGAEWWHLEQHIHPDAREPMPPCERAPVSSDAAQ